MIDRAKKKGAFDAPLNQFDPLAMIGVIASPDVVDSRTPPPLATIAMKCLSKNPAERFQRGNEVADALIGYLAQSQGPEGLRTAWLARRLGITPTSR